MTSAGVRELEAMALAVNYHRWTANVALPFLGQRVLEVGGGLGSFTQLLAGREHVVTIDNDPACTGVLRRRFQTNERIAVRDADILDDALPRSLQADRLDSAVCINVLEHIEDDRAALRNIYRALQPGGRFFLLVPAHPRLYGTLDEVVGHYRRYTRTEGIEKLCGAGFTVLRSRYFNSVGAVGRYVIGKVRRQQETGHGQVRFYDQRVVPVLSRMERLVAPPFGQSLVVVGRKD
ncbi:MAG TPA: class I SAM-dependent methyltransferase [Thermomicrobiales bacterium]|jgi:SAM-dependent methyltransferase